MKARGHGGALLVLAVLGSHGSSWGTGSTTFQSRPPAELSLPASSRCIARCTEMESKCEELEKRFPSCSTINICFEEKLQCEALCRGTAMLPLRTGHVQEAFGLLPRP
jgi:hypothetical protein